MCDFNYKYGCILYVYYIFVVYIIFQMENIVLLVLISF